MNRIWVGSWDVALSDTDLFTAERLRYERIRGNPRTSIEDAQRLGELPDRDPDRLAASVLSFTPGLVVQALFDRERFPAATQTQLVDDFLAALARRTGTLHHCARADRDRAEGGTAGRRSGVAATPAERRRTGAFVVAHRLPANQTDQTSRASKSI